MSAAPRIETARLILRPFEPGDARGLLENFADPVAARFWFTPDHSLPQSQERIVKAARAWEENGFGDWAVVERDTGRFAGFCGLHFISGMREVNLGFLLNRALWGQGYGTEAARAALDFGFTQARLPLIVGVTHPDNAASIKVLNKCGLRYWKDIVRNGAPRVVYLRRRAEEPAPLSR